MNPILSVIIVTFQSQAEIKACLESIPRRMNGREIEVIVLDNASHDETARLVTTEFPDVRFFGQKENLGFAEANNRGFEVARGEFILFLNPDTVSNDDCYRRCLARLAIDSRIGIISPKLVTANGNMDLACRRSIPTVWDGFCRALGLAAIFPKAPIFAGYNLTFLPEDTTYEVGAVNGAFMMCPRSALVRFGVFDSQFFMYGDDLDLCYRCRQAGYKVVYDGTVNMIHLKGMSSSQVSERMAREVFRGTQQFYLKHFNPHNSLWVRLKYQLLFGAWRNLAVVKARVLRHKKAQPP